MHFSFGVLINFKLVLTNQEELEKVKELKVGYDII